jgi:hypothetical protein
VEARGKAGDGASGGGNGHGFLQRLVVGDGLRQAAGGGAVLNVVLSESASHWPSVATCTQLLRLPPVVVVVSDSSGSVYVCQLEASLLRSMQLGEGFGDR